MTDNPKITMQHIGKVDQQRALKHRMMDLEQRVKLLEELNINALQASSPDEFDAEKILYDIYWSLLAHQWTITGPTKQLIIDWMNRRCDNR